MSVSEIPLARTPQSLTAVLGGTTYALALKWNRYSQCWLIDVRDATGLAIAMGLAMVTGADLLEQLRYLGFAGGLQAQTDNDRDAVPAFTNLGSAGRLFYVPD